MQWVILLTQILKALPELLKVAEKVFDGVPDSGAQKKEMVMTTVKVIVTSVAGESFWTKIESFVSPAVDFMCLFLFPKPENKK